MTKRSVLRKEDNSLVFLDHSHGDTAQYTAHSTHQNSFKNERKVNNTKLWLFFSDKTKYSNPLMEASKYSKFTSGYLYVSCGSIENILIN